MADQLPTEWRIPPSSLSLDQGEVHVWRARLDRAATHLAEFEDTLSRDERERAARLRFPEARVRLVAGRGILRILTGRYLDQRPETLAFAYGPHGKPYIGDRPHPAGLRFNVSHCGDAALLAFSRGLELGVDIQEIWPSRDTLVLAERFFARLEVDELRRLSGDARTTAFFTCWARKEAYVKALGLGLALPFREFAVSADPERHEGILIAPAHESPRLAIRNLPRWPGYAAALAIENGDFVLKCWEW